MVTGDANDQNATANLVKDCYCRASCSTCASVLEYVQCLTDDTVSKGIVPDSLTEVCAKPISLCDDLVITCNGDEFKCNQDNPISGL